MRSHGFLLALSGKDCTIRISSEDKHRKSSSLGQDWLLTDSINPEHKKVCIPRKQGRGYNMGRNHSPAERAEISLAHLAAAA